MPRDSVANVGYGVALAIALAIVVFGGRPYLTQVTIWMALSIALAMSLRFMLLVGEVNLAVGAFFGIGGYGAAILFLKFGLPTALAVPGGGVLAAAASIPFGLLTLRLTGHYFMLVSFALTEILRLIYTQSHWLGGNSGLVGIVPDIPGFNVVILVTSAAIFALLLSIERSHLGRLFAAISQNRAQVSSVGISVANIKLLCLVISSFTAGIAGASFAFANTVIAPGDFDFLLSVFALAYVKVGGQAHPLGTVVGTILLSVLAQFMMSFGAQDTLLYGTAIVATMLFVPEGIVGSVWRTRRKTSSVEISSMKSTQAAIDIERSS